MSEQPERPALRRPDPELSPFRLLAERATDLISRHAPDGTYLYASPACRRLLGWEPAELVGRLAYELFHPDDIAAIARSHERVINDDDVAVTRYRMQRKDGTWTWFETTSHLIRNPATGEPVEIQAVSRDISERIRAEEQLRVTLEVLTDGVVVFGSDGAVQLANAAAGAILGHPPERLVGAFDRALHSEDGTPMPSPVGVALAEGREVTRRLARYEHPDGRHRWLALTTRVLDQLGDRNIVLSISDVTAERAVEEQLRHLALHDPLTGLPNRTMLASHLEAALGRARRHGGRVGLLYIDLDGFKKVNDEWGHRAGDRLLIEVAHRLADSLRGCDLVARIGGDEFVLLCESLGGDHDAAGIARRVLAALDEPVDIGPATVRPAASIGASVAGAGTSPELLLHEADGALYHAKRAGGGVAGVTPPDAAGTEAQAG